MPKKWTEPKIEIVFGKEDILLCSGLFSWWKRHFDEYYHNDEDDEHKWFEW